VRHAYFTGADEQYERLKRALQATAGAERGRRCLRRSDSWRMEQAAAFGCDPCTINRSVLGGFEWTGPATTPWVSTDAYREFVGRYREIGFSESIVREPAAEESGVLERVASDVLPDLRGA
jgi:hypothetical protein